MPREERYRNYLQAMHGSDSVVVGTRSAIFAPVKNLSTVIIHKESSYDHYELRSPGWNSRSIALIRAKTESFKLILEYLIAFHQLNGAGEKLISENLTTGPYFEKIEILPNSKAFSKLYENFTLTELSATRYSLYPKLIQELSGSWIDIEALNQFEDPEIFSMKEKMFFVACAFYPQVSSTRDIPHPIIYTFLKSAIEAQVLTSN